MSDGLVEVVLETFMVEFPGVVGDFPDDVLNVGLGLIVLNHGELIGCAFGDFQEGVAGHFHDSWVFFLHEFE